MPNLPPLRRPDLRAELATAVDRARHARHHPDCRCGIYRRADCSAYHNAPFCTADERLWVSTVDKLIDQIRQEG